jgi:hypothetical protein
MAVLSPDDLDDPFFQFSKCCGFVQDWLRDAIATIVLERVVEGPDDRPILPGFDGILEKWPMPQAKHPGMAEIGQFLGLHRRDKGLIVN